MGYNVLRNEAVSERPMGLPEYGSQKLVQNKARELSDGTIFNCLLHSPEPNLVLRVTSHRLKNSYDGKSVPEKVVRMVSYLEQAVEDFDHSVLKKDLNTVFKFSR